MAFVISINLNGQLLQGGDQLAGNNITAIVDAMGVTLLLFTFVCNLSCGSANAAAVIVGVIGVAGIIWGTVALRKHISRKNESNPIVLIQRPYCTVKAGGK